MSRAEDLGLLLLGIKISLAISVSQYTEETAVLEKKKKKCCFYEVKAYRLSMPPSYN